MKTLLFGPFKFKLLLRPLVLNSKIRNHCEICIVSQTRVEARLGKEEALNDF